MLKVGQKVYIIQHVYYHFLGEVVEVLGKNSVVLKNVRFIYSCQRGWTEFFAEGCKNDTVFRVFPDGHEIHNYISATPWHHSIPK